MHFKIIIPMFNVEACIARNVSMLQAQTHGDFECLLIDDLSTDQSVALAQSAVGDDPRFRMQVNTEKKYALGNATEGIRMLHPDDEDVIVLLDADDCLAGPEALATVAETYEQHQCWLTYGSYAADGETLPDHTCEPYPASVVRRGRYRAARWRASHLKTFKAGLWKHLPNEALGVTEAELQNTRRHALLHGRLKTWRALSDARRESLLDPSMCYVRRCYDKAIMFPLLELAGTHARFIPQVLYHYTGTRGRTVRAYNGSASEGKWNTRCIRAVMEVKPALRPLAAY